MLHLQAGKVDVDFFFWILIFASVSISQDIWDDYRKKKKKKEHKAYQHHRRLGIYINKLILFLKQLNLMLSIVDIIVPQVIKKMAWWWTQHVGNGMALEIRRGRGVNAFPTGLHKETSYIHIKREKNRTTTKFYFIGKVEKSICTHFYIRSKDWSCWSISLVWGRVN